MSVKLMSMVFDADPEELDSMDKLIMLAMTDFANDDGLSVYPSVKRLHVKTGMCERTLRLRINKLRKRGFLEIEKHANSKFPHTYKIGVHMLQGCIRCTSRGALDAPPGVHEMHPIHHSIHQGNHQPLLSGFSETTKSEKPTNFAEAFDAFWKAYPRRVSKGNARKAFKVHKCNTFIGKILAAIETQQQSYEWTRDGGQRIPYPASWLNAEGWDNEMDIKKSTKKKSPVRRLDLPTAKERANGQG